MPGRDFLLEIGTEELPSAAVLGLSSALGEAMRTGLAASGLGHRRIETFGTPRRLAVLVRGLADRAPDAPVVRRGPPVSAAIDPSGAPTRAALAFAESCGVAFEALGRTREAKGEFLQFAAVRAGEPASALLPAIVNAAVAGLPVAKRMRWGAGDTEFARPVHWLVMLHGTEVVPATVLGLQAGDTSYGHRFMAPRALRLASAGAYEKRLARAFVICDFAQRRERIRAGVTALAAAEGGTAVLSESLLEEVTALVEWPVPVAAGFDPRFLELPPEVLLATLQGHQRYFAIRDAGGRLTHRFITVANIDSRDPAQVAHGNERVVGPRLADADFFWNQDRSRPLSSRIEGLRAVTYQAQLGSYHDKAERISALATRIGPAFGIQHGAAARAAMLCKCDLLTGLVGEFPELQGTMGGYYARHDREPASIAQAIGEHYQPRFAGDVLPASALGRVVSVADKLDTIVGSFALGQKPSGTRDPYGLRRAALGILRILIEGGVDLDLADAIGAAVTAVIAARERHPPAAPAKSAPPSARSVETEVYDYLHERLRGYYAEADAGVTTEMFDAVFERRPRSALDFDRRLKALSAFLALPEATPLAAANKRIANILRKSAPGEATGVEEALLAEPEEAALYRALGDVRGPVNAALARHDYAQALHALARLRGTVDAFFDRVLVNAPDERLKANRLALLRDLRELFLSTADLSRLPG